MLFNLEFFISLNLILPLIGALYPFIRSWHLGKMALILNNIALISSNIIILLNYNQYSNSVILANILNYKIALTAEPLAIIFALMVSILWLITNLYSFVYLDGQRSSNLEQDLNPKLHFFFTPLAIMSTISVGYSANLLTLFVFYEFLTLVTYPLVIQSLSERARKAGRIYLAILFGSSTFFLLFALIYIDYNYGIEDFNLKGILPAKLDVKEFLLLLICFIFGLSKTAIFPLYKWLPTAMVAPIPVSGLLHAVAVVKSGIFALIKVFIYVFGIDYLDHIHQLHPWAIDWLTLLACFTIIYAGILAAMQDNLKKILAFSTISQLSYMILALSFTSYQAVIAAFLQMIAHSIAKITLFFIAGVFYIALHKTYVSQLRGVIRIMPLAVILFIFAAISIIGIPISIGFLSAEHLHSIMPVNIMGYIALNCLGISSFLSCYYFFRVIFNMVRPDENIIVNYNTIYMVLITGVSFVILSILYTFYMDDIIHYLTIMFKTDV